MHEIKLGLHICVKIVQVKKKHYNALSTMRMLAYAYKNFDNRITNLRVHIPD